jgi:hypothetical protein
MAITGGWKEQALIQSGALKQGAGYNPIHGIRYSAGRSDKPPNLIFSTHVTTDEMPLALTDQVAPDWAYENSDVTNPLWGNNEQTGLSDQPNLGDPTMSYHTEAPFPSWGPYTAGLPGGTEVRSYDHGAEASNTPKQQPYETVTEGWENKARGDSENQASVSDPSQYEMQTSMIQRNKVRAGSQRGLGSASEYDAPVTPRVAPWKMKVWSGLLRHYDMQPKEQELIIRPWWTRQAYTGPTGELWNETNELYRSEPMQRVIPPDPHLGEPATTEVPPVESNQFGYQYEDALY